MKSEGEKKKKIPALPDKSKKKEPADVLKELMKDPAFRKELLNTQLDMSDEVDTWYTLYEPCHEIEEHYEDEKGVKQVRMRKMTPHEMDESLFIEYRKRFSMAGNLVKKSEYAAALHVSERTIYRLDAKWKKQLIDDYNNMHKLGYAILNSISRDELNTMIQHLHRVLNAAITPNKEKFQAIRLIKELRRQEIMYSRDVIMAKYLKLEKEDSDIPKETKNSK